MGAVCPQTPEGIYRLPKWRFLFDILRHKSYSMATVQTDDRDYTEWRGAKKDYKTQRPFSFFSLPIISG